MNSISDTIRRRGRNRNYILLTGATGLVGRYLMRDFFLEGCRLAVLVRPGKRLSAEERIEAILQEWEAKLEHPLPRPVVFEGDVAEKNLGLDEDDSAWIREHVDHIIHNAAILNFTGGDRAAEPWRTNYGGTANVINFARDNELRNLSYVSTAYVSGIREDVVSEADFDTGQQFRNEYEKSKFEAEQLVRDADCFDSVTIFRPGVIVGDSESGYTSTYHGLFLYLRLLSTIVETQQPNAEGIIETPIQLPLSGDEPRNLITVDWVSAVISHVVCSPAAHGRTYHLTPVKCTTPRRILDALYKYFNTTGVEFTGQGKERVADSEFATRFFENARVYEAYETNDPRYCRRNVDEFAGHIPCPAIDEDMIVRFLEFGQSDKWGKTRTGTPTVRFRFESHLDQFAIGVSRLTENLGSGRGLLRIGLDIHGPGGGQWQVTVDGDDYEIARGLPCDSHSLLRMDIKEAAVLLGNPFERSIAWSSTLERFFQFDRNSDH